MLTKEEAQRLSGQLKIDRERIVRESYEIFLLSEMSKEPWSRYLIFKGGTALRLAYNSPRFSDDLDFSLIQPIPGAEVFRFAATVSSKINAAVKDRWEKRNTILVEFGLTVDFLPQNIGLKIEISKRASPNPDHSLSIIRSPVSPLEVLFKVQTLEDMLKDKFAALQSREEPRDLFDAWYICQKLRREMPELELAMNEQRINQVLKKYLPLNWHPAVAEIIELLKK